MLVRLRNILAGPFHFFHEEVLSHRAVGYVADRAGGRFAVVHMEVEFYGSLCIFGDEFDHLLHLIVSGSQLKIPGQSDVRINVKLAAKLLDFHIMNVDPFRFPVLVEEVCQSAEHFGIGFIHNST